MSKMSKITQNGEQLENNYSRPASGYFKCSAKADEGGAG